MNTVQVSCYVLVLVSSIFSTTNGTPIGDWTGSYVRSVIENPDSTSLTITAPRIGVEGAVIIADLITTKKFRNTKITSLSLSQTLIRDEGVKAIAQALPYTKITRLNLAGNGIGKIGAKAIADTLKDTAITHLILFNNFMRRDGAPLIINSLVGSEVIDLNLARNDIGDGATQLLASILEDTKITNLNLEFNLIGVKGIKSLSTALHKLTSLNLGNNRAGDEGAKAISAGLKDSELTSLNLASNSITDVGAEAIASVLEHTQIVNLYLEGNQITPEALETLAMALEGTLITQLSFEDDPTRLDPFIRRKINLAIKKNVKEVDVVYDQLHKFVRDNGDGQLEFAVDEESERTDYEQFVEIICSKKKGWTRHLVTRGGKMYGGQLIVDFVENIRDHLAEFLHKL